jgi:signal peptidase II
MDEPNATPNATSPPNETATPTSNESPASNETTSPSETAASVPVEEPLAPGVPRLGAPRGAARSILDPTKHHPSYLFLAVVSIVTLVSDIGTKLWAEKRLDSAVPFPQLWDNHLTFTLAKNRGGAWGLLQTANENVRRPFFLLVSVAAIAFIVTLYRRLTPKQRALKWGLPLVLGGALGNVFDRIRYGHVIDFIDYRAEWVRKMNDWVGRMFPGHGVATDHWPTFNVADVAICIGVALMAIDMFGSKRAGAVVAHQPSVDSPSHDPQVHAAPAEPGLKTED